MKIITVGEKNIRFKAILLTIVTLMLLLGCKGTLFVSHPQVNTRERLVEERHREYQWLRTQLDKSDEIETTYQGLRDFREFVGIYNELKASFNPTQGVLDTLTNEAQELSLKTQLWNQRGAEYDARQAYLKKLNPEAKGAEAPTSTDAEETVASGSSAGETPSVEDSPDAAEQPDTVQSAIAASNIGDVPSATAPFSRRPSDIPLPDPGKVQKTKAQAHPLDLFHDKLAYRNAVNAEMKAVQLDDSHDFGGRMLYELSLHVSMTPGKHAFPGSQWVPGGKDQPFAQVKLNIKPADLSADRVRQLSKLYRNWRQELTFDLAGDIARLQSQVTEGNLARRDSDFLHWFITRLGPYLLVELENRTDQKIQSLITPAPPPLTTLSPQQGLYDLLSEKALTLPEPLPIKKGKEEVKGITLKQLTDAVKNRGTFETVLTAEDYKNLKNLVAELRLLTHHDIQKIKDEHKKSLRCAAAWAVWGSHVIQFDRIVGIKVPTLNDKGWLEGGLRTIPRVSLTTKEKISAPIKGQVKLVSKEVDAVVGTTGVAYFIKALSAVEKHPHALTVTPKEHAQNISEAAAREHMLNLILALSATIPEAGVKLENQAQYVRRSQRYLHAITRQPLLVGYGNGDKEFGWFLGPAFRVDNGKASFQHRTIRHDVTAGIVVPAWWSFAKLTGKYGWISRTGNPPDKMENLWDGKPIYISLRMPKDVNKHITAALVSHSVASEPFLYAARPKPVITIPKKENVGNGSPPPIVLQAYPTNLPTKPAPQQVLVLGDNLWRTPQIIVGSQKAHRIEVLAGMEGVLAEFDELQFPGRLNKDRDMPHVDVDLTVLTSFGYDRVEKAVRILRPVDLPIVKKPETKAALLRHYTDDQNTKLTFAYPQPKSYASIYLMTRASMQQGNLVKHPKLAVWDAEGKIVSFDVGKATALPELLEADLRLQPKANTTTGTRSVVDGTVAFVKFKDEKQRSFSIDQAAGTELVYTVDGSATDKGLVLTLDPKMEDAFKQAYPGLAKTIGGKGLNLQFRRGGKAVASFKFAADRKLNVKGLFEYIATKTALGTPALRDALLKHAQNELSLWVIYLDKAGKEQKVPVRGNKGKPATLKFKQKALAKRPFLALSSTGKFKAEDPQNPGVKRLFEKPLYFIIYLDQEPKQFKNQEQLMGLAALSTDVILTIENKLRASVNLKGQLTLSQGKALVVTIKGVDKDATREKLLDWTSKFSKVTAVQIIAGDIVVDVKDASGTKAATLTFTK